ncbi:MAG: deoxyribose-phosphate aldolase [bacterium]
MILNHPENVPGDCALARLIDHTLLHPCAGEDDIKRLCHEAVHYHFWAVCVHPVHIRLCASILDETGVRICTVIGFPLGANTTATKVFEAKDAESSGADEIDMVMNIGAMKERSLQRVRDDMAAVVNATSKRVVTKVIIENAYLSMEEKIIGCILACDAGADFCKTSTGFAPTGATVEDVALMRHVVGEKMGIKAAGGIRDRLTACRMVAAGADRIGASSSVGIVTQAPLNGERLGEG